MAKFRIHWLTGNPEDVEGNDAADAFTHAGYSAGALRAVDWIEEIKEVSKVNTIDHIHENIVRLLHKDYNNCYVDRVNENEIVTEFSNGDRYQIAIRKLK